MSKSTEDLKTLCNTIKVWVWTIDHESMRKWYQEEFANRITE
jgi:hypothetical protein